MKTKYVIIAFVILFMFLSCDLFNTDTTGTLILKGVKSFSDMTSLNKTARIPAVLAKSATTHFMYNKDIEFNAHEIYISTENIVNGFPDTLEWFLVGENDELLHMYEYEMSADLPEGQYISLKIVFRNEIIREAVYVSDTNTVVYMAGSLGEGGCGDTSLIVNYFGPQGSFRLDEEDTVRFMTSGENFQGFRVNAGETSYVYWKGGAPNVTYKLTDFTFYWDDNDGDSLWTCGIDHTHDFDGPADTPMWSFYTVSGGDTTLGKP